MMAVNGLPRRATATSEMGSRKMQHVAILLSTYNGERFLEDQLDSIIAQSHYNWTIYASDDGSTDGTVAILEKYHARLGPNRLKILTGPQQGFAKNFLSLVKNSSIEAEYFAFCDQDDIWLPERLSTAITTLETIPQNQPALFCSRTRLIDEEGSPIGLSPLFKKPTSFKNAIVQSIAGGNTMLFNQSARELLKRTCEKQTIISHDWWLYMLVSGCGGQTYYSSQPLVDYRQHGDNLIGSNSSLRDRLVRIEKIFRGTFREWNESNLSALIKIKHCLTPESLQTFEQFQECRETGFFRRLTLIISSGLYRQTTAGQLGLIIATIFKRI